MSAFEKEEYEIRISKVRKSMDEKNIEVLIVTDPSNMAWLTGYDGWSFYVHQCVVLSLDFLSLRCYRINLVNENN
jgi:ectoine hydrolase